jgi:radical SAM protein with 4Fe4S-binding SPASM domain
MPPSPRIRYLQLETGTACNYRCVYCPVAFNPRRGGFMEIDLVRAIVRQLATSAPLEEVYLNGYDEPTLNRALPEIAKIVSALGGELVVLTNATRLTVQLANALAASHPRVRIDIHLSADDEVDFRRVHQSSQYHNVRRNLDQLAATELAPNISLHIGMQIGVDTTADERYRALSEAYAQSAFTIARYRPNGRAGILDNEWADQAHHTRLGGCGLRHRTSDWLHINANGNVVLCCQDYFEEHVLGNVASTALDEILTSDLRRRLHRWTTGVEQAPEDYICRRCSHAIPGAPATDGVRH